MASSTSKSTGRCSSGSKVRWPGSTSRSSHVSIGAPRAGRRREAGGQLGPCRATLARRRDHRRAVPSARAPTAYFEMRGGRAETSIAEAAQRLDVLQHAEAARRRQPPRHDGFHADVGRHGPAAVGRRAAAERRTRPAGPAAENRSGRQRVQAGPGVFLLARPSSGPGHAQQPAQQGSAGEQLGTGSGRADAAP